MQSATSVHVRDLADDVRTIAPDALFRAMATGRRVVVIDVRESDEVESSGATIPDARHVPAHHLFVRRNALPTTKTDLIVTVSNGGELARAAAHTLHLLGYTDVRALDGGFDGWVAHGLPVEPRGREAEQATH